MWSPPTFMPKMFDDDFFSHGMMKDMMRMPKAGHSEFTGADGTKSSSDMHTFSKTSSMTSVNGEGNASVTEIVDGKDPVTEKFEIKDGKMAKGGPNKPTILGVPMGSPPKFGLGP